jgi:antitoxin component YwqK of YwqJK toxin-antitoxin module
MKKRIILALLLFTLSTLLFAQADTIDYRPHNLTKIETTVKATVTKKDGEVVTSTTRNKRTKYTVDNKKSNKKNYDQSSQQSTTIDNCKPCWLRYYDQEGKLLQEGLSYSDCRLGKVVEYYQSGKVKVIRLFKTNDTNDWTNFPCSVAEGTWTYYTEDGSVEKTETYIDGKQIKE